VAEVLSRYVQDRHNVEMKSRVRILHKEPDMLDEVVRQIKTWFAEWDREYERIYLVTDRGPTAIATGLVLCALECSPDKVVPLHAGIDANVRPMHVVQQIQTTQRRHALWNALAHGRFAAAVSLIPERGEQLELQDYEHRTLRTVIVSTEQRLRFDLDSARSTLGDAREESMLSTSLHAEIAKLQKSLPSDDDIPGLLAELFHNARQKLSHEEYADFVLRLFNFQQAALRYAAERCGVKFNQSGSAFSSKWLEKESKFVVFAQTYKYPKGTGLDLQGGRVSGLTLLCLADYFYAQKQLPEIVPNAAWRLQSISELRNRCFAAHDFKSVGREELEGQFAGSQSDILEMMHDLYIGSTGNAIGCDPYQITVSLCRDLLGMLG
jgi:hypothetical protein